MTEQLKFEVGKHYRTRSGRKAKCVHAWEDGGALFVATDPYVAWSVRDNGKCTGRETPDDIVAGPDVPEDAVDYSDEELERLCDEQEQLEKKLNDEADEAAECAFHNGYRQAMMDAAELAIGCIGKDKRCDVAQLVRSLFRGYLIPTAEPPF